MEMDQADPNTKEDDVRAGLYPPQDESTGALGEEDGVLGDPLSHEKPAQEDERSPVFESRIERATELWESGKVKFRENDAQGALKEFERGLYQVEFDELSYNFELMDKHREMVDKVRTPLWLNVAACQIKLNRPKEALENCDKVLKQDPKHVKALYRRARAREAIGESELALADLQRAHDLAKDDIEIAKALVTLRKKVLEAQKASDEMWRGKMKLGTPKRDENGLNAIVEPEQREGILKWFWAIVAWIVSLFASVFGYKNKNKAS